ncbi:hypothetical protein RIF29_26816 [Crotalaria pallida]|uniref:Transmembrane protein n=1 Tax=Crotalaria pallida TaxID=3830 RepID=A0AAN9EQC7_CROPI
MIEPLGKISKPIIWFMWKWKVPQNTVSLSLNPSLLPPSLTSLMVSLPHSWNSQSLTHHSLTLSLNHRGGHHEGYGSGDCLRSQPPPTISLHRHGSRFHRHACPSTAFESDLRSRSPSTACDLSPRLASVSFLFLIFFLFFFKFCFTRISIFYVYFWLLMMLFVLLLMVIIFVSSLLLLLFILLFILLYGFFPIFV